MGKRRIKASYTRPELKPVEESDFVKEKRGIVCKGCREENAKICSCCHVLDCWLRSTFLPEGEWARAAEYDMLHDLSKNFSDEIDKEILRQFKF